MPLIYSEARFRSDFLIVFVVRHCERRGSVKSECDEFLDCSSRNSFISPSVPSFRGIESSILEDDREIRVAEHNVPATADKTMIIGPMIRFGMPRVSARSAIAARACYVYATLQ